MHNGATVEARTLWERDSGIYKSQHQQRATMKPRLQKAFALMSVDEKSGLFPDATSPKRAYHMHKRKYLNISHLIEIKCRVLNAEPSRG